MPKTDWDEAVGETHNLFREIKKKIPKYDYSDPLRFHLTDEQICSFLMEKLEKAKVILFNIIEYLWERQQDRHVKIFQDLKDEVEIFADEVFVKKHEDSELDKEWLKKLINYDFRLVQESERFLNVLEIISGQIIKDNLSAKNLAAKSQALRKLFDFIVIGFKERAVLSEISEEDLKRTFEEKSKEIRGFQ